GRHGGHRRDLRGGGRRGRRGGRQGAQPHGRPRTQRAQAPRHRRGGDGEDVRWQHREGRRCEEGRRGEEGRRREEGWGEEVRREEVLRCEEEQRLEEVRIVAGGAREPRRGTRWPAPSREGRMGTIRLTCLEEFSWPSSSPPCSTPSPGRSRSWPRPCIAASPP